MDELLKETIALGRSVFGADNKALFPLLLEKKKGLFGFPFSHTWVMMGE
jgi:hypothetical protein